MICRRTRRLLTAAAAACLLIGSSAAAQGETTKLPAWAKDLDRDLARAQSSRGDHVHTDDPWLILYSEVAIDPIADGQFTQTYRKAWQNISDEKRPLSVSVPFDSATETLSDLIVLKQRRRLWNKITGTRGGVEVPELSSDFVTADRVKILKTSEVRPGDRVFATWTITSTETFPRERILMPMETLPVNRFVVLAPDPALLRAVGRHGAVDDDGYELTRIPAIHRIHDPADLWRPSFLMTIPSAFVSLHTEGEPNWRDAARRARTLFDAALAGDRAATGDPEYVRKTRELTSGLETMEQKIAALATFAQSLVYRNVAWGVGAYQPEPPSEILRTMSGDCKAKVLLLSAMLAEIGVESMPVLARLGEPYLEYQGPPTTNIFNHMVLAVRIPGEFGARARLRSGVGAGWILFDPTDPLATFGIPPNRLQGTLALWLGEYGDRFYIEFAEVADRFGVELDFDARQPDLARFRMTIDGASPYAFAANHNSDPDLLVPRLKRYAQESLRLSLPSLQLDEVLYDPPNHLQGRAAKVTFIGSLPDPIHTLDAELLAMGAPTALVAHAIGLPRKAFREPPPDQASALMKDWQTPACCSPEQSWWEASIDIALPRGWKLAFQPRFDPLENPWISASIRTEGNSWQASIRRLRGCFPDSVVARRATDLNGIARTMQHAFVIRKSPIPQSI